LADGTRTTRLNNGVRVVTESVPGASSVAVGIWVESGSRHEDVRTNGVSHFIEHLAFKGTATRTASRIAEEIESLGGTINAFTTKEHTCYHTRTLAEHLEPSLDVLSDVFLNSLFRTEDLDLEREVILQEIFDIEDSPEDFLHDYFLARYWPGHPLGWSVTGTVESVGRITRDDVIEYMARRYSSDRLVVAAAGRVDHDEVVRHCSEHLSSLAGDGATDAIDRPDFQPGIFISPRELEQVHVVLGLPGIALGDRRREALEILITALGGGMSSRLFQKVREERGLAYTVYAFENPFRDIGCTGVYAATSRDHIAEVTDLILEEISSLTRHGLTPAELARTKRQLIGSIPLSLESTESRMVRIARNQTYYGREISVDEVMRTIDGVTATDIIELAREVFAFERLGIALLGDAQPSMLNLPLS
jgi:predicted Zn-dependent peptidase